MFASENRRCMRRFLYKCWQHFTKMFATFWPRNCWRQNCCVWLPVPPIYIYMFHLYIYIYRTPHAHFTRYCVPFHPFYYVLCSISIFIVSRQKMLRMTPFHYIMYIHNVFYFKWMKLHNVFYFIHYIMCSISSISLYIVFHFILLRLIFHSIFRMQHFSIRTINNERKNK